MKKKEKNRKIPRELSRKIFMLCPYSPCFNPSLLPVSPADLSPP